MGNYPGAHPGPPWGTLGAPTAIFPRIYCLTPPGVHKSQGSNPRFWNLLLSNRVKSTGGHPRITPGERPPLMCRNSNAVLPPILHTSLRKFTTIVDTKRLTQFTPVTTARGSIGWAQGQDDASSGERCVRGRLIVPAPPFEIFGEIAAAL